MSDEIFHKLAKVLDTLPSGFPATKSGVEIKLLKKIFAPEEAAVFCDLRLTPETAEQIAERTGRPIEGLEEMLISMWEKGEIWAEEPGGVKKFKMLPWIIGIWEFQINRMDKEFVELCKAYGKYFVPQFFSSDPHVMQIVPVEKEITAKQEALTYEQVSGLIEKAQAFIVAECICKKHNSFLDKPCNKPTEVCLFMTQEPSFVENHPMEGRRISREEAYEVLRKSEEAGLVHLTSNVESGHWFICNCCDCCCGSLRAAKVGMSHAVNSHYYAQIDQDSCEACGICSEERCPFDAIEEGTDAYKVIKEKCFGCGLCASTCPVEAISLIRKKPEEIVVPVKDEDAWFEKRGRQHGVDYSAYK